MRIVIAGAGQIGSHLAKLLFKDGHDVTLIDEQQQRLNSVASCVDILTLCGSPGSISMLQEANVKGADLFIGVTPDESRNITCCMLAKRLGALKSVARVDNAEYTAPDYKEFFLKVGIDSVIYPEMLAAAEINHLIVRPWARQWWQMSDGKLLLFAVKVRRGVSILNRPLAEIAAPDDPFHITAVKRNGETLIPHGNDCLEEDDLVFVMTTSKEVTHVRERFGKAHSTETHCVFYMGAADTVIHSINTLPHHIKAKVFERNPAKFDAITAAITHPKFLLLDGDGRDIRALQDENVSHAEVFVAASENCETNILACLAARRMGVQKTIAMVENTDYIAMAEQLDIGSIINKKAFAAAHIHRMLLKADVKSFKSFDIANADVIEYKVHANTRITRKPVAQLNLPPSVNIGGYLRDGEAHMVNGNTTFKEGDLVVLFCLKNEFRRLEKYFN